MPTSQSGGLKTGKPNGDTMPSGVRKTRTGLGNTGEPGEAQRRGLNSKLRGKRYERDVAKIFGATRHKADTGGLEDLEHPILSIQVKSGLRLVNDTIRTAVDAGRANTQGKLGCAVLVDRSGPRIREFIVFDAREFAAWCGFGVSDEQP